jgi:hypothetical protein
MIIKRFEDIDAWRKARELTKAVYGISKMGEFSRDFGLKIKFKGPRFLQCPI